MAFTGTLPTLMFEFRLVEVKVEFTEKTVSTGNIVSCEIKNTNPKVAYEPQGGC